MKALKTRVAADSDRPSALKRQFCATLVEADDHIGAMRRYLLFVTTVLGLLLLLFVGAALGCTESGAWHDFMMRAGCPLMGGVEVMR